MYIRTRHTRQLQNLIEEYGGGGSGASIHKKGLKTARHVYGIYLRTRP